MDRKELRNPSEIKVHEYTLEEILERHLHWINRDCDGWVNMKADLSNEFLKHANLSGVDLSHANLSCANLSYADLSGADLFYADLSRADLRNANLSSAYLRNADLCNADLCNADLCNTNLYNANLHNTENIPYIPLACPSDGAFTAWKKVKEYLVKLEIPASAKRCSATTRKCRASKAKVLGIYTLDGRKTNLKNVVRGWSAANQRPALNYIVGETVYPDSFDENRWNECSHGIHFFVNKQDAIDY